MHCGLIFGSTWDGFCKIQSRTKVQKGRTYASTARTDVGDWGLALPSIAPNQFSSNFLHPTRTMESHPSLMSPYTIQPVPPSDPILLPAFQSLFDESVAWLTSKGLSAQWGSEPLKDDRRHAEKAKKIIEVRPFLLPGHLL